MQKKFLKQLEKYAKSLDLENSSLLVVANDLETGSITLSSCGNWEQISLILSNESALNLTDENRSSYDDIRKLMLNTTLNILAKDKDARLVMLKALTKLDE